MPYTSLRRITDAGLISNSEKFKSVSASDALILAGGGHCHALLLRRWAMQPQTRPNRQIILVSCNGVALYSGLVPALIAGVASREQASINLRWLAQQAGVAFVQATITGLNPQEHLRLHNRPNLPFAHLSLNLGAVTRRQGYRDAISIKATGAGPEGHRCPGQSRQRCQRRTVPLRRRWLSCRRDLSGPAPTLGPTAFEPPYRRTSPISFHGARSAGSPHKAQRCPCPRCHKTPCSASAVKSPAGYPKAGCAVTAMAGYSPDRPCKPFITPGSLPPATVL